MKRRKFMRLLYGSALGVSVPGTLAMLAGCGSGGGNSLAVVPGPSTQRGLVNTGEIGGSGLLVQSVYAPTAPVAADGSFSTTFSAVGPQLISVTDGTGALRGLGLFNPAPLLFSPLRQTTPSMVIDLHSTAVSLVYITPGILTTDTTEGIQRQSQISNLTTFPALLTFVTQNLKSGSLQSILGDPSLDSLKGACIREWAAGHGFPDNSPALSSNDAGGFSANLRSDTDKPLQANLTNRSWRWINVARVDLDGRKIATGTKDPVFGTMAGAAGGSWGAIFGSAIDLPATATEVPDLNDPGSNAYLEYWIRGPARPLCQPLTRPLYPARARPKEHPHSSTPLRHS
ncbi:MAG: hypothetical protein M3Y56_06090 [Armatimonadota bacterium]|nr:hypothetical protein [Armatimonadota bacterium]